MNHDLIHVIEQIGREKGIDKEILIEAVKTAMLSASKKRFGYNINNLQADFDDKTGKIKLFSCKEIVKDIKDKDNEILLEDAIKIDPKASLGDKIEIPFEIEDFGRIAAQTAKQIIVQKVREAERDLIFNEFNGRQGELANGIVQREEKGNIFVDLGKAEAIIPRREQSFRESFRRGERIKAYIIDVKKTSKGPQIFLSRTHPVFLVKLFELEVPEIDEGIIEIKEAVREPTGRSKIAVFSKNKDVDPVGACVGIRGSRVQSIVQELRGEKIDIVEWSEDTETFAINALSPAKISLVKLNREDKSMEVIVNDDQLSLAIGKKGQNVRLAARLIHWKIDIKSESQYKSEQENIEGTISITQSLTGLGKKTTELLLNNGFETINDILKADIKTFMSIKGIGEKTAERIKSLAENYLSKEDDNSKIIP